MRKLAGGAVLAGGLVGLGWWGTADHAVDMEDRITAEAQTLAATARHGVEATVAGRDITLTGTVESEAERSRLLAAYQAVEGRRVVRDDLTVLPQAETFVISAVRDDAGLSATGMIPSEADRATLGGQIGDLAEGLTLTGGAPDGWTGAAGQGFDALAALKTGRMELSGQKLTLSGLAALPADRDAALAALDGLPAGYSLETMIEVEDDGRPFALNAAYDGASINLQGKVPRGMQQALQADAGNVGALNGQLTEARIDDAAGLWPDLGATGLAALGALDEGALAISGTTVNLTGVATPDGRDQAEALIAGLPDSVTKNTDISIRDDGQPFTLNVAKAADGTLTSNGKLPSSLSADALNLPASDDLRVAYIDAADGGFAANADAGLAALNGLDEGTLAVTETSVRVTGVSTPEGRTRAEGLLAALPDGVSTTADIAFSDDGQPFTLIVAKAADGTLTSNGKLPSSLSADALNLPASDDLRVAYIDAEDTAFADRARAGMTALGQLDEGTLQVSDDRVALTGTAADLTSRVAALEALGTFAADDAEAAIAVPEVVVKDVPPIDGDMRVNAETGQRETFRFGSWLPAPDFTPSVAACQGQSDSVLQEAQVNFVSGRADLDASSTRTMDRLALVLLRCAEDLSGKVELGGHTDSVGKASSNQRLSQARAETVRDALVARGVDAEMLTAVGYGETQPIADNETEEGRAANRRTTVTFGN